ncbi:MAG: hypothetical protein IKU14_04360, partial [Rhodocyclaceae bacterium]|nr:hypothetical protein [Rhodocyclaceae bacterium]
MQQAFASFFQHDFVLLVFNEIFGDEEKFQPLFLRQQFLLGKRGCLHPYVGAYLEGLLSGRAAACLFPGLG